MTAYYNEIDPYAAQWLRNLISKNLIAPGEVDERSIEDINPDDLRGFAQCHFFAGIGVWSYALRRAGWPDDRPVWTGSCPCQPFSAAGKGKGSADERHLWPAWHHLIRQCRPDVVFGEQVEAAIGHGWLDLVQSDLEGEGYACGAVGLPACGVGAPHIRQRLWFVADSEGSRRGIWNPNDQRSANGEVNAPCDHSKNCGLADSSGQRQHGRSGATGSAGWRSAENHGADGQLADTHNAGPQGRQLLPERTGKRSAGQNGVAGAERPGPTDGHWRAADWLHCRDGRWRPVESGTFPLVDGAAARVGRLRAYGNAIVPQVAAEVIKVYMEYRP